jgi:hypothetical protein
VVEIRANQWAHQKFSQYCGCCDPAIVAKLRIVSPYNAVQRQTYFLQQNFLCPLHFFTSQFITLFDISCQDMIAKYFVKRSEQLPCKVMLEYKHMFCSSCLHLHSFCANEDFSYHKEAFTTAY